MRNFFKRTSEKTLKRVYRILTVIIATILVSFSFLFFSFVGERLCYPLKYKEEVIHYSQEFGLDNRLIFSMIREESGFNKRANSLMQITDKTANFIAKSLGVEEYDLYNADTNIRFGCFYVGYLKNKFINYQTLVAAYNAGEGRVYEWLKDNRYSDDGITLKYIPYQETRAHVEKIQKTFEKYRKLYGNILDKNKNFE